MNLVHGTGCAGRSLVPTMTAVQHSDRELPANRPQSDVMHREAVCCAVIASAKALLRDRHMPAAPRHCESASSSDECNLRHAFRAVSVRACIRTVNDE